MAEFYESFDPEVDLIYGIGAWISRYIIFYDSRGTKRYGARDHFSSEDWNAAQRRKDMDYFAINTFNTSISNATYALDAGGVTNVVNSEGRYMKALQSTKYGTSSTTGPLDSLFDKLKKSNANLDRSKPANVSAAAKDLAIRRSSKFGIKFVADNLNGTVHYILDEISQDVLLAKATITNGSGYTKIPICTSEIRYLFRTWGRYKDRVVFWANYATTSPPWECANMKYSVGWASYALERMWKYRDKVKGYYSAFGNKRKNNFLQLVTNVDKYLESGATKKHENASTLIKSWFNDTISTPSDIIRAFHGLPHSLVNDDHEPV